MVESRSAQAGQEVRSYHVLVELQRQLELESCVSRRAISRCAVDIRFSESSLRRRAGEAGDGKINKGRFAESLFYFVLF
jgi:hypothetical protein